MWSCRPTMPGISVMPVPSTTCAPAGTFTFAAGPTSAMRPSRITTVWPGTAGVPLPSITVTPVIAISGAVARHVLLTLSVERRSLCLDRSRRQEQWPGGRRAAIGVDSWCPPRRSASSSPPAGAPRCDSAASSVPGLDISTSRSSAPAAGRRTVSFHTGFSFGVPFTASTRNRWPWMWMGWCMP